MAGGKETPRQKMIGMMYLVLTAMLALNVSKSILEAFVAIEENIQKANMNQVQRGDKAYKDVKDELTGSQNENQKAKKEKLKYVLQRMDLIDKETASIIQQIDQMKLDILKTAGEEITTVKNRDHSTIMWEKTEGVKPARMNLFAVNAMDNYDVPMQVVGVNEDLKKPKGKGLELWNKFNEYRKNLVELTGTYAWSEGEKFEIKVDPINEFSDFNDLSEKVSKMLEKNGKNANLKDDKDALASIYMEMTKLERNDVGEYKGLHWLGMTFDHSPLVAGIASLSSMQQNILSARAMALEHWKSRVSTGEYSFNRIAPLAYGQPVANTGDSVYLRVMMAAFDSDNQPEVKVLEGTSNPNIVTGDGQGIVGFVVGSGTEQVVKGTVAIKNKSGMWKTEEWEYRVLIMKPSGAISLPELNVLYRGYENQVEAVASGFDQTNLSGTGNVSLKKTTKGWLATPSGPQREVSLTVSGKNSLTGKSQNLLTQKFQVRNMPKPEIFWGTVSTGNKGSRQENKIFAKYGDEIPLAANFSIVKWTLTVSGHMGEVTGSGNILTKEAMDVIKQARSGASVSIMCEVIGPDKIVKRSPGSFKV